MNHQSYTEIEDIIAEVLLLRKDVDILSISKYGRNVYVSFDDPDDSIKMLKFLDGRLIKWGDYLSIEDTQIKSELVDEVLYWESRVQDYYDNRDPDLYPVSDEETEEDEENDPSDDGREPSEEDEEKEENEENEENEDDYQQSSAIVRDYEMEREEEENNEDWSRNCYSEED